MHITFMRLMGVFFIGCGLYILLSFFVPKLRDQRWRAQPAGLFGLGSAGCVLLGLWALGIARPYTWIAGALAFVIGFFVQRRSPQFADEPREPIMSRREAVVVAIFLLAFFGVVLRVFLG
jgi:hypothetical protein